MSEMFKCPACGHGYFRVVSVKREKKSDYKTEFIACSRCRVMQWWPVAEPRNITPPPFLRTWGKARTDEKE